MPVTPEPNRVVPERWKLCSCSSVEERHVDTVEVRSSILLRSTTLWYNHHMDANKREKLLEVGYQIPKVCGLCKYGRFKVGNDFGDCTLFTYEHQKHSAESKPLSIVKYGGCPKFEPDSMRMHFLHAYTEFMVP